MVKRGATELVKIQYKRSKTHECMHTLSHTQNATTPVFRTVRTSGTFYISALHTWIFLLLIDWVCRRQFYFPSKMAKSSQRFSHRSPRENRPSSKQFSPTIGVWLERFVKRLRRKAVLGLLYTLVGFSLVSTISFWTFISPSDNSISGKFRFFLFIRCYIVKEFQTVWTIFKLV